MNSITLLQQIFEVCIIPLLGVLTAFAVAYIKAKMNELSAAAGNATEQKYLKMISETITKCVIATNQTYVDSLKNKDAFNKEAQKEAFELTYNAVLDILSDDAKDYIAEAFGDAETYLTTLIEEAVNKNKL